MICFARPLHSADGAVLPRRCLQIAIDEAETQKVCASSYLQFYLLMYMRTKSEMKATQINSVELTHRQIIASPAAAVAVGLLK